MRTQHFTTLTMIVLLATAVNSVKAEEDIHFRGVVKDQGGNVIDKANGSNAMNGRTWYVDVQDNFDSRSGALAGSEADTWQVGFVPPTDTRNSEGLNAQGPLSGVLADEHGRWVGDGSYLVEGGQVRLSDDASDNAVATLPWRVAPDLGDDYLVEANMTVAAGESGIIGFTGDAANTNGLMDGEYGQLALQVSRSSSDPTEVSWQVNWDVDEAPGFKTEGDVITVPEGEIRLQLAWNEVMNTFDAWLDNTQLSQGTLGQSGISVHALAFQLVGGGSRINSAIGAIPEPSSMVLMAVGLIGLLGYRNRK